MIYFTSHPSFATKGAWAVKLGRLGNFNDKYNWKVSVLSWPLVTEFSPEPQADTAAEKTVNMEIYSQHMFRLEDLDVVRSRLGDMINTPALETRLKAAGCPSDVQESVRENLIDRMVVMITERNAGRGFVWEPVQGLY